MAQAWGQIGRPDRRGGVLDCCGRVWQWAAGPLQTETHRHQRPPQRGQGVTAHQRDGGLAVVGPNPGQPANPQQPGHAMVARPMQTRRTNHPDASGITPGRIPAIAGSCPTIQASDGRRIWPHRHAPGLCRIKNAVTALTIHALRKAVPWPQSCQPASALQRTVGQPDPCRPSRRPSRLP